MRSAAITGAAVVAAFATLGLRTSDDVRFAERVVEPGEERITFHWKDADGRILGDIGSLQRSEAAHGRTLRFAMNGGMYTQDQAPLGLYIEEGRTITRLITKRDGHGNFYLQPNGVFGLTNDGRAFLCTTSEFPLRKDVRYATQSGPMLLAHGTINAAFREGSANVNIRNGVGLRPDGSVVFAISRVPVNFHDFAGWFKGRGCTDALYLDGAISRAYMPDQGLRQLDGTLGVLIAVSD